MSASMRQFCSFRSPHLCYASKLLKGSLSLQLVQNHRIYFFLTRGYARGVKRIPLKVFKPDEVSDAKYKHATRETASAKKTSKLTESVTESTYREPHVIADLKGRKLRRSDRDVIILDGHAQEDTCIQEGLEDDGVSEKIQFERANADDKRLGKLITLLRSRKTREKSGKVVLEGRRLLTDAMKAGVEAEIIFFSRFEVLKELPLQLTNATFVKVPYKDIKTWSDLMTPYGVIGVFKQPKYTHSEEPPSSEKVSEVLPLTLICDQVRDPGNMGTIIRSAVAAQCDKILVTKGCVDIWDSKVLRAGAGAHFHSPIFSNLTWNDIKNFVDVSQTSFHIADNNLRNPDGLQSPDGTNGDNEKQGTTESEVSVKSPGGPNGDKSNVTEHNTESEESVNDVMVDEKSSHDIALEIARTHMPELNTMAYYNVDWTEPSALVIGGETHGLSLNAWKLCEETHGCRVNIPINDHVESLNNAMAASIIMFEAQRQSIKHNQD